MDTISVKMISWEKGANSRLEFNITGVNNTIINCIRRIGLSDIPIYSFNDIKISENTSIFNNNYMKLRISNLPVLGIMSEDPIYIKKETIKLNKPDIDEDNEIDMSIPENLNSSTLKQLTMYLDITNDTSEIITVGTDQCKFYYMEKQIESPYKTIYNNIPIIKLQAKQKIKISAITCLGIESESSIFSAVSVFGFKQIDENSYDVFLESRGQLDEKTILNYINLNIFNILDKFINLIPDDNSINGKIILDNADHTIGTLLAYGLQNHKKVKFAGYNMPHLLNNLIQFHYELYEENNIKDILIDVITKIKKTYKTINTLINDTIIYKDK